MTKPEAAAYLAQACNDLLDTLPPSAKGPTGQALNHALQVLGEPEPGQALNEAHSQ